MKTFVYILLFLQFLFLKVQSQTPSSLDTIYVLRSSSTLFSVFPYSNNYTFNGITTDWVPQSSGGYINQARSMLATIDIYGNNLDTFNFSHIDSNLLLLGLNFSSFEGLYTGVQDELDCLYSIGIQLKVNSLNLTSQSIKIVKTDSIGNLIWDKIFEVGADSGWAPRASYYDKMLERIFIVGDIINPNGSFLYPFISEFDTSGLLINTIRVLNQGDIRMNGITVDSNSNFFLSGFERFANPSSLPRLWKISPNGQVMWSFNYAFGLNYSSNAFDILLTNDNKLIVTYVQALALNKFVYHLQKVELNGTQIWDHVFTSTRQVDNSVLYEMDNSNIVNVCMLRDTSGNGPVGQRLTMWDSSGVEIWHRIFYTNGDYKRLYDLKPTKDGGFIMCGDHNGYLDPVSGYITSQSWVLKTDSLGLITSVNNITPSYIANASIRNPYPNPANSEINIEVFVPIEAKKAFLHLFDMSGKELQTIEIVKGISKNNISLQGLSAGNYLVALSVDDYAAGSKRIVKVE